MQTATKGVASWHPLSLEISTRSVLPDAMIRSELVARVAELNPHLYAKDVEAAVNAILARMMDALTSGGRIELRDFGSFAVTTREAREGRNPKTGAKVNMRAKNEVHFRQGKAMRKRLRVATSQLGVSAEQPSPRPGL